MALNDSPEAKQLLITGLWQKDRAFVRTHGAGDSRIRALTAARRLH